MNTASTDVVGNAIDIPRNVPAFSLMTIVSFIFQLELRDKLANEAAGDGADGAIHWGL